MKKVLLFIACMMPMLASAQSNGEKNSFTKNLYVNLSSDAMSKTKGYTTYGADFQLGWKFTPALYAFATCKGMISLFDGQDTRNFLKATNIGAGLGYRWFLGNENKASYDIKASVTTSTGSKEWKNTTYEAGLFYRFKSCGLAPQLGLGYRYIDSRSTGVKSFGNAFASIGFSF